MKFIATSDLHLGQTGADKLGQHSLLSARATPNLVAAFAEAAAAFAAEDPVTLVFAGDLLDLSLAYAEDAFDDLRELLSALRRKIAIDEIVYVVGNHDQHLWSLHSEDKRLLKPLRSGATPRGGGDKAMYQVTSAEGEPFAILQPFVDHTRFFTKTKMTIAYPVYARQLAGDAVLYVTHGHLFGGLYTELSSLFAQKFAELPHDRVAATVNQPIIELIYWLLGETGEGLGADGLVEAIYTDAQRGKDGRLRPVVERLVAQLLPHGVLWRVIGALERRIIVDAVMSWIGKELLSPSLASVTSADRFADIEATREKLGAWLRAVGRTPLPVGSIVLYGHTHVRDDYEIPGAGIHSYNLGTWLVEPNHDQPETGFLGIDGGAARWIEVPR